MNIGFGLLLAEICHFNVSKFGKGIITGSNPAGDHDLGFQIFFAEIVQGLDGLAMFGGYSSGTSSSPSNKTMAFPLSSIYSINGRASGKLQMAN